MKDLLEYFEDQKYIKLKEVSYCDVSSESKRKLNTKDYFDVTESDNDIYVLVQRQLGFNSESSYFIKAAYEVRYIIKSDLLEEFKSRKFDLKKEFASDPNKYIIDEMDRISLIISQITDSFEGRPLVTRPFFKFEESEE